MAIQNPLNLTTTGIVSADGTGVFAGRTITGTTDFIDAANGTGVAGNPTLSIATNFEATGMHGWNGSIIESPSVTVASDGATITLSVEKSGGGNLTAVFSDGYYTWTTAPDTVTLTAGTDASPQINYVYLLQSTKTLTSSTVAFPSAEHAPIATVICQSAASLQIDGPYKVHAWTDHVTRSDDQGHVADLNSWIRQQNATWIDGVNQTYTITVNGGAADNVILTTSSGNVLQLHSHSFPAFAGTPDVYVVNDSVTPYTKITDLNAALTDSTGASMSGNYFSLVLWGVVSEASGDCKLFLNLPGGSYNNASSLAADADRFANFNIPSDYRGTGFLISKWDLRHQATASGTWTSLDEVDLRSFIPNQSAGGTTAAGTEFIDNVFRILDDGDNTKEIAFQASGITTATTRTLTVPDNDGTITLGSGFTQYGTAVATNSTTLETVATSATAGVPLVSAGAAANPAYGTAVVAGGGTGATTLTDGGVLLGSGTGAVTATAQPGDGQLLVGQGSADPNLVTAWMQQGNNCFFWNLSFTHAAGTLTLAGSDGTALSATNPGYVIMPSNATQGRMVLHEIVANDTLTVSDLTGNLFGTTTAIAWADDLPLYVGFMADSTDANIEPVIARMPNIKTSPAASADIGDPSSATADKEISVFAWNDITEANYQSMQLGLIGSLRATKAVTTDAWTLTALDDMDGAGRWNESRVFTFPVTQNGAAVGKNFKDNGGTAPRWGTQLADYYVGRYGRVEYNFLGTECDVAGVGAVNALLALPLNNVDTGISWVNGSGHYFDSSAGDYLPMTSWHTQGLGTRFIVGTLSTGIFLNSSVDTNDYLRNTLIYQLEGV